MPQGGHRGNRRCFSRRPQENADPPLAIYTVRDRLRWVRAMEPDRKRSPNVPSKIYFIDALTNEEIPCEWNGWFPAAMDASVASPASRTQFTDTTWGVTVKPGPYTGKARTITAADFPGRVVKIKEWVSGITRPGASFRLLASREMGFVALNEVEGRGESVRTSDGRMVRLHVRGEILRDRRALEWIARRIASKRVA